MIARLASKGSLYARGRDLVARGCAQVSPVTARLGLAIPLHIAAERVLDKLAVAKPAAPR